MEPIAMVLLACVVISSVAIVCTSLVVCAFYGFKAYLYAKSNGMNKEEVHQHYYDHSDYPKPQDLDDDDPDAWKRKQ